MFNKQVSTYFYPSSVDLAGMRSQGVHMWPLGQGCLLALWVSIIKCNSVSSVAGSSRSTLFFWHWAVYFSLSPFLLHLVSPSQASLSLLWTSPSLSGRGRSQYWHICGKDILLTWNSALIVQFILICVDRPYCWNWNAFVICVNITFLCKLHWDCVFWSSSTLNQWQKYR